MRPYDEYCNYLDAIISIVQNYQLSHSYEDMLYTLNGLILLLGNEEMELLRPLPTMVARIRRLLDIVREIKPSLATNQDGKELRVRYLGATMTNDDMKLELMKCSHRLQQIFSAYL